MDPGSVKIVELPAFKKIISFFVTVALPWRIFSTFMKMLPNVSFISMVIKKMFLSVSIAAISNFLQKCTHCRHNYELSQPKIGQCVYVVYTNCFLFLFWHSEQFMYTTCSDLVVFMCWTGKLMYNILSHCGFVILD